MEGGREREKGREGGRGREAERERESVCVGSLVAEWHSL